MGGLTARQEQVLAFIRESIRANGYPPTVREICTALQLSSPSTVHAHLANLERQGLIKRDPTKPRALDLAQDLRPPRPLPLVGQVAAGALTFAEDNIEELVDVPGFLRRDDGDFVLRIHGDSMIGAGIFDGDLVVVHPQDDADNGEIVVALVGDEATTKRFYREGARSGCSPRASCTSPSSSTRPKSTWSAGSWGCCAGYERRVPRRSTRRHPRRPARRDARRRARLRIGAVPLVRLRDGRRGRRPLDGTRRPALPVVRERARGCGSAAWARGAVVSSNGRTTERARPVPASAGAAYREMSTRPGRAGARVRRDRRARRIAGLLRFAVFLLLVFVAVWAGVRVANADRRQRRVQRSGLRRAARRHALAHRRRRVRRLASTCARWSMRSAKPMASTAPCSSRVRS